MKQEEFIETIRKNVTTASIAGTIENLEAPPGRKPSAELSELSHWYNQLDNEQKENIKKIVTNAVNESVFGFLSIIDGVRSIKKVSDKEDGRFKLIYSSQGVDYFLNDEDQNFLHDLYNS